MEFNLIGAKPALLVVDVQAIFSSPEGPFENTQAEPMIHSINTMTDFCRSRNIPVIHSRYLFRDDMTDAGLLKDHPVVSAGHFCSNAPWIGLDERIVTHESDLQLSRNRPSAYWGGTLDDTLQALKVDTIVLCGLSVNNAISSTARDGFSRDHKVLIPKDAVGAAPWEEHLEIYFDILDTWSGEVSISADLMKRLEQEL